MNIYFEDERFYKLERQKGLLYVTLQAVYEGSSVQGTDIRFILDTGAYMTVISRGTAIRRGFDKLPKKTTTFFGFGGGMEADFVIIPGLIIAGKFHTNVPVLIPHDMYRVNPKTREKKQMPEVLGLNVLEYYNYFIDTEHDRLYLKENKNPRFGAEILKSGQVYIANIADTIDHTIELTEDHQRVLRFLRVTGGIVQSADHNGYLTYPRIPAFQETLNELVYSGFVRKEEDKYFLTDKVQ